jgi:hypothetical protein
MSCYLKNQHIKITNIPRWSNTSPRGNTISGSPWKSTPQYGYCSMICDIFRHTCAASDVKKWPPSPLPWRINIINHRLSRGSHAPGAPNKTLGHNIGTLSKNQATKMDPKAKSPEFAVRHLSSYPTILACNIKPQGKFSLSSALPITLS